MREVEPVVQIAVVEKRSPASPSTNLSAPTPPTTKSKPAPRLPVRCRVEPELVVDQPELRDRVVQTRADAGPGALRGDDRDAERVRRFLEEETLKRMPRPRAPSSSRRSGGVPRTPRISIGRPHPRIVNVPD